MKCMVARYEELSEGPQRCPPETGENLSRVLNINIFKVPEKLLLMG